MEKRNQPITVRLWVPDSNVIGGYRPMQTLPPDELAAFRHKNAVRMAAAIQQRINVSPSLLERLPDCSTTA